MVAPSAIALRILIRMIGTSAATKNRAANPERTASGNEGVTSTTLTSM